MSTLDHYKLAFNQVGWFIPPYVTMGFLSALTAQIIKEEDAFTQDKLEQIISQIYSPENLSPMVTERYPIVPYVNEYKEIISESIVAHFMGLNHVAVAGLMPAIEGAGRKIAIDRGVEKKHIKDVFVALAEDCKRDSKENNIGAVGEVISMMDSFIEFATKNLYIQSEKYSHNDNTNRHGILHGAYSDDDYGDPINFYKSIAAIDFLCFVSSFKASISWFAPSATENSMLLLGYYQACISHGKKRPTYS